MSLIQLLFSFQGRINRTPWWLAGFAMFIIIPLLIVAVFAIIVATGEGTLGSGGLWDFLSAVLYLMLGAVALVAYNPMVFVTTPSMSFLAGMILLIMISSLWISLALGAKRLHDRSKSAWWLLLFWLLPAVLHAAGERIEGIGLILILIAVAFWIWGVVEMGFLRGTAGPNQYGPGPLDAQASIPAREGDAH